MCFVGPCVPEIVMHIRQIKWALQHKPAAAAVKRQCTQTSSRQNTTQESLRPPQHYQKKNSQCHRGKVKCMFVTGCKVHFCDQKCPLPSFTLSKKRFGKLFLVQSGPLLGVLWALKPLKQQGKPAKTRQKCVKITHKWVLGAF